LSQSRKGLFPPEHQESVRGHGRIVHRFTRVAPVTEAIKFPYAAQVVVVERKVADLKGCMVSTETSYYVTSLTSAEAGADRIAKIVRGHWEIENGLHWVRDVTWDEDRSQVRTGSAPRSLASFRNLAIAVFPPRWRNKYCTRPQVGVTRTCQAAHTSRHITTKQTPTNSSRLRRWYSARNRNREHVPKRKNGSHVREIEPLMSTDLLLSTSVTGL